MEFYATEVPRLMKVIEGNRRRLEMLKEKKRMVFPEVINGICVFIAGQRSSQVKGILSSLIYYLGRRNLIIEEGDHAAVWGARGFSRDFLESELTTLQVDRHALGLQTSMDNLADHVPKAFKQVLNITKNITIQKQYMGGMGGRGLIFGGNINLNSLPLMRVTPLVCSILTLTTLPSFLIKDTPLILPIPGFFFLNAFCISKRVTVHFQSLCGEALQ